MYLTEKEAQTKWCPFVRLNGRSSYNRDHDWERDRCLASECMAWRQSPTNFKNKGYCGLAGKPEE